MINGCSTLLLERLHLKYTSGKIKLIMKVKSLAEERKGYFVYSSYRI